MYNFLKASMRCFIGSTFLLFSSLTQAGQGWCGTGYITSVYAGGWNQDGLIIHLEAIDGKEPPNFFSSVLLRFSLDLTEKRLDMIQAVALLALANGNAVELYSHNVNSSGQPDCSNMTQIKVFRR